MISEEQLETLHRSSLRLLGEVGVEMLCRESLELMAQAGCSVDMANSRVRIPPELAMRAIHDAPARFTLHARNPERSVEVGGDTMVLVPVGGPSMVADLEGGPRPGCYADQVNFIKLSQHSHLLDMTYRCVEAQDLPPATRHLDYLYAAIRFSDKPLGAMSLDGLSAQDTLILSSLLFGGEQGIGGRSVVLAGVNVDTPLRYGRETLEAIMTFARAGQPLKITPFILPGVMSPATLAGALAQENAEILAGITLAQTVNPGTPVLYGTFASRADMRTAAPLFGGSEGLLMEVAGGQLSRRYGLPHRGMGLVTSAPTCGTQAAMEKMNCLWSLTYSHVHLLMHAAGWLEGGLTASYEQFMLDLEMLESMERFLAGFTVSDETLALDTIAQVGPGGSFLMAEHTLTHHKRWGSLSRLLESRPYDAWQASGSPTLIHRARALWQEWLEQYQEPPIDAGVEAAVREYVERRKRGEPPAVAASQHYRVGLSPDSPRLPSPS